MRIFLIWAGKGPEIISLINKLKSGNHEVVYWLGHALSAADCPADVLFHAHADAEKAQPARGLDTSDFLPPGEDIIKKLYKTESIILTMLNRFVDWKVGPDERRHLYYRMLGYWIGVLEKLKPDVIIFPVEPHQVYDYLLYELAKIFSIKTIFFNETRVSDRLLYMSDFRKGSAVLMRELEKNNGQIFQLSDLSSDVQDYYLPRATGQYDKPPLYVDYLQKKYSFLNKFSLVTKVYQKIKDGTLVKTAINYLNKWRMASSEGSVWYFARKIIIAFQNNLKKDYEGLQTAVDMEKKFVYAALQVQPERSTSPQGDAFVDQILMLQILSASLPPDWLIYVKEHPIQWLHFGYGYSNSRYPGYYQKIADLKNVKIVPCETDSFILMRKAVAIATITGAPAWEAVLRSKPAVVFGYPWYKDCPGIFKVDDVESCRQALSKIVAGYAVDQQLVINFLKCLDRSTIHGYIAPSNQRASKLSMQESLDSIGNFLLEEFKSSVI